MQHQGKSIRPFIGAADFAVSRSFYAALGFQELVISETMSYFRVDGTIGFYLQDAYVKDWVDNSMLFLEVADLDAHLAAVNALRLPDMFPGVRISTIQNNDWGREYFMHDPSGILWHFGSFRES